MSPSAKLAALSLILFAGCGTSTPDTNAQAASGKGSERVGVVLPMFKHPFFVSMRDAIEAHAKELGVEVNVRDGQDDDQKQILQVEALIGSGIDVLVLCPRDENAAVAAVEAANRAKIPVVTLNRRVNGGEVVTYVGADDTEGGREQAQALVDALGPKGGKIVYLQGTPGSSPQVNRNTGLRDILDKHPEIVIASDSFTDFQEDRAKAVMSGLVGRFPSGEIRAIVAQADELALPAAEVAVEAGWKDVIVIGFNGTKPAFDAIRSGKMHATILQNAAEQGRLALDAALAVREKKTVPPIRSTPLPVITKANLDEHQPSY